MLVSAPDCEIHDFSLYNLRIITPDPAPSTAHLHLTPKRLGAIDILVKAYQGQSFLGNAQIRTICKPFQETASAPLLRSAKLTASWEENQLRELYFMLGLDPENLADKEHGYQVIQDAIKRGALDRELSKLRNQLLEHLNEDDLRRLCLRLAIDYEVLPGVGELDKTRELLFHLKHHGRIPDLLKECRRLYPSIPWEVYVKTPRDASEKARSGHTATSGFVLASPQSLIKFTQLPVLREPIPAGESRNVSSLEHDNAGVSELIIDDQRCKIELSRGRKRVLLAPGHSYVTMPVSGNSMNKIILEGSYVVIHLLDDGERPVSGDIVAAESVDSDEVTLKNYVIEGDSHYLEAQSTDPEFQNYRVLVDNVNVRIRGVVIAILKPVREE